MVSFFLNSWRRELIDWRVETTGLKVPVDWSPEELTTTTSSPSLRPLPVTTGFLQYPTSDSSFSKTALLRELVTGKESFLASVMFRSEPSWYCYSMPVWCLILASLIKRVCNSLKLCLHLFRVWKSKCREKKKTFNSPVLQNLLKWRNK